MWHQGSNNYASEFIQKIQEIRPGVWRYKINGMIFDIPDRYIPGKLIGQGAYGIVCSAIDTHDNNESVAIKKIILRANEIQLKRTLREIKLLHHFENENILGLKDIFPPPPGERPDEIYIVTELMDSDLSNIISSGESLTDDHLQLFLFQILRGLKYIHSANVIHRDIKPGNIFLNKNCLLKIADFGLARAVDDSQGDCFLTDYVATRWYRAPEVILSWKQYTKSIDVWAAGCVFAELLLQKPLFQGKDYVNQIAVICSTMGTPSDDDVACIQSEHAKKYIMSLGYRPKIPLENIFLNANPEGLDLLEKMLTFNPEKRFTVEQCLAHPYLKAFRDSVNELVTCEYGNFDFSFEKYTLTKEMYYDLIYQEMLHFHPEILEQELEYQRQRQIQQEEFLFKQQQLQEMKQLQEMQLQMQQIQQSIQNIGVTERTHPISGNRTPLQEQLANSTIWQNNNNAGTNNDTSMFTFTPTSMITSTFSDADFFDFDSPENAFRSHFHGQ